MKKLLLILTVLFLSAACNSKTLSISNTANQSMTVGMQTFSSATLGLSFSYWYDGTVIVKEQGNKILIYPNNQPNDIKFIEVFKKDPAQTFSKAIQLQFLSNAPSVCQIQIFGSETAFIPPAFDQQAKIVDTTQQNISQQNHCGDHSGSNGDSYFAYNSKYSDRFYFYEFGQDAWPALNADGSGDFRSTIQIIK